MDFRFKKTFFIRLCGGLLRLFIIYLLIPATLVFLIVVFYTALEFGPMLELADKLSSFNYLTLLTLVSLIPLGMTYWWQRDNKPLLWLCITLLILHVVSLEYFDVMPNLTIETSSGRASEYMISPSLLIMTVLLLFSIIHFLLPNQYSRPYLSLLPFFLLISWYYEAVAPVLGGLVGILSSDPTSPLVKAEAINVVIYFAKSVPGLLLVYSVPFCLYLLAMFWQPLTDFLAGILCQFQQRRASS
ncbi:hypothetical protein [Methylophaga thiooxydans]|uniref:Uncharacterized protein n=1 Tax=Methylophaga thiooxydans DMS010 TaxID=637616 RepID=C0N5N4_9GAMM|nr:hypothetical protein [Methylophaga thiooxydans]EEF79970.1 hypothetical protein MDMS009_1521 [Methylophaga thiooxydans DMS010]